MAANDDQQNGSINSASWGGVAGTHDTPEDTGFLVGPSTASQLNTIRKPLVPIACWRVDDIRFDQHPGCPIPVFGHADPAGTDDHNKSLSGRRATAVYAILIANSNLAKATSLWQNVAAQENWTAPAYAAMRAVTGQPAGTSNSSVIQAYLAGSGRQTQNYHCGFSRGGRRRPWQSRLPGLQRVQSTVDLLGCGGRAIRATEQQSAQPGQRPQSPRHGFDVSQRDRRGSNQVAVPARQ